MTLQKGVALIQVLLMSALITILAMQIAVTSQKQVGVAKAIQDRAYAEAQLRSFEAELLYKLMIFPWATHRPESAKVESIENYWNFHGEKIELEGVSLTMQDDSGLVSLFRGGNAALVENALAQLVEDDSVSVREIRRKIRNMQGYSNSRSGKKGQFFQSFDALKTELQKIGVGTVTQAKLGGIFSRLPHPVFRPLQSPNVVLYALLPDRQAEAVISARKGGKLTQNSFMAITGINRGDDYLYWPGGKFKIRIESNYGEARVIKESFVKLAPKSNRMPISYLGVTD